MNRETGIRRKMTPDVVDEFGEKLVDSAFEHDCGARFTGAGGGGCIWALGEQSGIERLKNAWVSILGEKKEAHLLDLKIDHEGLICTGLELDKAV